MSKIVYLISFFTFAGFYAVLAILISWGLTDFTRYINVPLRLVTSFFMIYLITRCFSKKSFVGYNGFFLTLFCFFWILYLFKIIWHYGTGLELNRQWYEYVFYALNFSFLPFITFFSINFNKYKNVILSAFLFSGFVMGLLSFYLYKDILVMGIGRISNIVYTDSDQSTLSPLALSYAGSLTISLCIYKFLYEGNSLSKIQLIYLFLNLVLSIIMFYLGASRGSVVALFLSILVLFYYGGFKIKLNFLTFGLLFFPLLIFGSIKMGSSVFSRTTNTLESDSIGVREKLWLDAWNEFLNYPFLGGRIEIGFYPHNFILEVLMATGFIGFILLFSIILKGIINLHRRTYYEIGYIWVLIVLSQGLVQYIFSGSIYLAILMFLPLGIAFSRSFQIFNKFHF